MLRSDMTREEFEEHVGFRLFDDQWEYAQAKLRRDRPKKVSWITRSFSRDRG